MCEPTALAPVGEQSDTGRYTVTTMAGVIKQLPPGRYFAFLEGKDASITVYGRVSDSESTVAEIPSAVSLSSPAAAVQKGRTFSFSGDEREHFELPEKAFLSFVLSSGSASSTLVLVRVVSC